VRVCVRAIRALRALRQGNIYIYCCVDTAMSLVTLLKCEEGCCVSRRSAKVVVCDLIYDAVTMQIVG
jgi:hypothetical protein